MALTKAQKLTKTIRIDLQSQLELQNKKGKYFSDLVEDYIYFLELKQKLQEDIECNGLRLKTKSGNGFETEKANESVLNLLKVSTQMLKILSELGLQEPTIAASNIDEDYC